MDEYQFNIRPTANPNVWTWRVIRREWITAEQKHVFHEDAMGLEPSAHEALTKALAAHKMIIETGRYVAPRPDLVTPPEPEVIERAPAGRNKDE